MVQGYIDAATHCGARSYQQDRFVVHRIRQGKEKGWLLAVADGHGDSAEVAEFCEKNLADYFTKFIGKAKSITNEAHKNVIKSTVKTLSDLTKNMDSGSTLSLVYISETKGMAFVGILGDSPIIIRGRKGSLIISPEHNARTNLAERKAATKRGAIYSGGYIWDDPQSDMRSGLQLTRALGNKKLARFISRKPEIYSVNLGPDSFVVVMSDGVVDPGHKDPDTISHNLASLIENGATAADLVNDALKRRTGDNVTTVLWKQPKP
ncbi:MAG: PP2C family protein-serine/threonine phosphatase [Candidatus Taylorbacteria bacterium]|nr:PP2C family protein-serine/threonine phosphatase [Candidatus Taylorbacteria bacterium]